MRPNLLLLSRDPSGPVVMGHSVTLKVNTKLFYQAEGISQNPAFNDCSSGDPKNANSSICDLSTRGLDAKKLSSMCPRVGQSCSNRVILCYQHVDLVVEIGEYLFHCFNVLPEPISPLNGNPKRASKHDGFPDQMVNLLEVSLVPKLMIVAPDQGLVLLKTHDNPRLVVPTRIVASRPFA